jgi:uncharacterized protein YbjT (DUF2867 family)
MKILMVGATGKYANHVPPELKQRGVTVRALVRDKNKVGAARQQGADEAVVGDLRNADSLYATSDEHHRAEIRHAPDAWYGHHQYAVANDK